MCGGLRVRVAEDQIVMSNQKTQASADAYAAAVLQFGKTVELRNSGQSEEAGQALALHTHQHVSGLEHAVCWTFGHRVAHDEHADRVGEGGADLSLGLGAHTEPA